MKQQQRNMTLSNDLIEIKFFVSHSTIVISCIKFNDLNAKPNKRHAIDALQALKQDFDMPVNASDCMVTFSSMSHSIVKLRHIDATKCVQKI